MPFTNLTKGRMLGNKFFSN
uniref:Uncharacterized protein n=1 Tax=Anguilla anguilla TaxID=7936 RepID=A0A0E9QD24_ANGAN